VTFVKWPEENVVDRRWVEGVDWRVERKEDEFEGVGVRSDWSRWLGGGRGRDEIRWVEVESGVLMWWWMGSVMMDAARRRQDNVVEGIN
jgi:hypothetical protein